MDDLSKKNGIDFHKEYISLLVKDHEDEIKEFKKEVDTGKDAEIKTGHPVKYRFWNIIWHQQKIQKNISKTTSKLFLE